jgi:hypothetical protein
LFSKIENPEEFENGVFEYSIKRGNHINRLPEVGYSSILNFIEQEKILFLNIGIRLIFIDFYNKLIELSLVPELKDRVGLITSYSKKFKYFIAQSINEIKSFQYLTETNIENQDQNDSIIYPNPTTNNIKIETSCELNEVQIELMDINGALLISEITHITDGYITFDLSSFPSGSYFIRLNCGEEVKIYNVVKEG